MPAPIMPGSLGVASSNETNSIETNNKRAILPVNPNDLGFRIVAIGASSGGLKASIDLFDNVNLPTNMAFILVQHLEPSRESLLVGLMQEHTKLKVLLAENEMPISPEFLYIIPAGAYLTIKNNCFKITRPERDKKSKNVQIRMPFDLLLKSSAQEYGSRNIAIILSGTGKDGSVGINSIKEAGGYIIAQNPDDATSDGMPKSAIATNLVDEVCNASQIGERLKSLPHVNNEIKKTQATADMPLGKDDFLNQIINLIKIHNAHDFTQYKLGTLQRRIERRMTMIGVFNANMEEYLDILKNNSEEREKLCDDLLINVTSFFRDEEVFEDLSANIISKIVNDCPLNSTIRVWVAGCSTGEEAYSLAILFREVMENQKKQVNLQIFASDLDTQAIAIARDGQFNSTIKTQISPERLKRHFRKEGQGYRINPNLRSKIIFTVHNVLTDPPFSNIDFVSCRNLLIYLTPIAQAKIIARFHFSLKDNGLLLLGKAETAGHAIGRFEVISKNYRLYRRIGKHEWNENSQNSGLSTSLKKLANENNGFGAKNHLDDLKQELEDTKVQLLGAMNNLELSEEVQKTINEEALSVSEEFQSANEELITSKEELQALNEELSALNSQLQEALDVQRILSNDLQNVLYSTDIATLFLDKNLNIRFFTPATRAIFNIIASDIGRPLSDLNSSASDPSLPKDLNAVLNGDAKHEREVRTNDGKWYLRRVLPYLNDKTSIEGVVITFGDITERKHTSKALDEARLEAERANLAKSRFLAVASHDLRQPLQSLALLQGLLANLVNSQEGNQIITRLNETLDAITSMLNSLLDLNQIESGLVQVTRTNFCIGDLLQRLYNEFSFHARAQNLELRYVKCDKIIFSDMRLLEQMIRNLISNAFKYTPNGKVLIGCRQTGENLRIEILDTGIGIDVDNLETIFEAYNQVANPTKASNRGLGLGLSIVQRLSQLLHLKIDVKSKLYRGSVFSVEVPLAKQNAKDEKKGAALVPVSEVGTKSQNNNSMIMVIEDDSDVRELLLQLLEAQGFDAVAFKNGIDSYEWVTKTKIIPNLILADYNLSNYLNGVSSGERIRKFCKSQIPIIILTGDTSKETIHDVNIHNCLQLNKPVKHSDLINLIAQQLGVPIKSRFLQNTPIPKIMPKTNPNWIYIVDDDNNLRHAMRQTFENQSYNVADFENAESFLNSDFANMANCILIDAYLPNINGLEVLENLKNAKINIPTIMITGNADIAMSVKAMKAGAIDFLEKPIKSDDLLQFVELAIERSKDKNKLSEWQKNAASIIKGLTPRQLEVMNSVMAGKASKVIAYELGISQRTVENHRALIMRKTNAKSIPALARLVLAANQNPIIE
ncbi:MAG: response regulator [Caulobacterales bacterium]|nr:response regulator [Caulobacterales bacterium]MCA0373733.1 response regulator [Pseudomonadota bacterium]